MAADYSRIHRLLKILALIQGAAGWTPRRLAQECGTTERTIYRDLRTLEAAGIPYFFDQQTRSYTIRRDFFMPPVQLTLDESLALAALAEHVGGKEQVPFTRAAVRAIAKIRGVLPSSIRSELERAESHVSIRLAASSPPEASADVYDTVRRAIQSRTCLRCQYESLGSNHSDGRTARAAGDEEFFLLKPYALFFGQRAWYVIGHHAGRGEVRCLKLSRFTRLDHTEQPYSIPSSFSVESHLGQAWRMIRGKKRYDVELRFDAEFAETVSDTQWHPTQEVIWHEEGSITFRCSVDGLEEIVWWVLSMGPHCIVRKPKELARQVQALAEQMLQLYA